MNNKKTKLSGKEQAKLNKRKKFYSKLERVCEKFANKEDTEPIIVFRRNKGYSFPEFDDLSIILKEDCVKYEAEIDVDKVDTIDMPYLEEAHFLINTSKLGYLTIFTHETSIDNEGQIRKGQLKIDDGYNYQLAYNWGIEIKDIPKLQELAAKEKEDPTIYDMTPKAATVQEPVYRKSAGFKRRRRR